MGLRVIMKSGKKATEKDLLFQHNLLHHAFKKLSRGGTWGEWTRDKVITTHDKLVLDMRGRSIGHHGSDALDNTLKLSTASLFESLREFRVRAPFVSIVGGFANWEASRGDLDFMLGTSLEGNIIATSTIDVLAARAHDFTLHIQDSKFVTPFSNYIPLYNLRLKFIDGVPLRRSLATVFPHEHSRPYKSVSEFMGNLGDDDIVLFDDFVSIALTGEIDHVEQIDVYFSVELTRDMSLPIEFRIYRQFPQEYWKKFVFHYKEPPDDVVPCYALVLERVNKGGKVFEMGMPPTSLQQAKQSKNAGKVSYSKFFYPLKTSLSPLHAHRKTDIFSVEAGVRYLHKLAPQKKEIPSVYIEKKYDGLRCTIFKDGDNVKVFTDSGLDKTWRFPSAVKELKAMAMPQRCILDTECEGWIEGKHLDREVISGYVNASSAPNDSDVIFNVFDLLAFQGVGPVNLYNELLLFQKEGLDVWRKESEERFYAPPKGPSQKITIEDLHTYPLQLRRRLLTQILFKQSVIDLPDPKQSHFNLVVSTRCTELDIVRKALVHAVSALSSEGAMIKSYDGAYSLSGSTSAWAKLKKEIELQVIVWRKHQTAKKGVFNYDLALAFTSEDSVTKRRIVKVGNKEYTHVGRSYNTEQDLPAGEVVKIRFHNLNLYEDIRNNEKALSVYGAAIHDARGKDDAPNTITEALGVGRSAGLLHEKFNRSVVVTMEESLCQTKKI